MAAERRKPNLLKQQLLEEDGHDHLSQMCDDLLVNILSLLPTRYAARTSLLSYRFRHLWKVCSIISFTTTDLYDLGLPKFNAEVISMLLTAINNRNPSILLSELHLHCGYFECGNRDDAILLLLVKAYSLGLRHLTLYPCPGLIIVFPTIFTFSSLESLSIISEDTRPELITKYFFPTVSLPRLKSLSLGFIYIETTELNQLISELGVLENLDLENTGRHESFSLSSQTIKSLRLKITFRSGLNLNLPALQLLQLESWGWYDRIQHFQVHVPLLKKCVFSLYNLEKRCYSIVPRLLLCFSHIEELHLLLECWIEKMPYHVLLDPDEDVPVFANLKYLEVKTCFHELNCKDIITLVNNSPVLNSLKLIHQVDEIKDEEVRSYWRSKLPCNHDGNYRYGYFTNLYLEDNRKKFFELFNINIVL